MADSITSDNQLSDELKADLKMFNALKPFLGRCLTLNHDINNPLAGVLGYAEFLLDDKENLSDSQINYIQQILKCAERIRDEVESLCRKKIELTEGIDLSELTARFEKSDDQS